jgi:hypothetical protein
MSALKSEVLSSNPNPTKNKTKQSKNNCLKKEGFSCFLQLLLPAPLYLPAARVTFVFIAHLSLAPKKSSPSRMRWPASWMGSKSNTG